MNAEKVLAGALLTGIGIITGEITLVATAGNVGANWLAEGLAGLWTSLQGLPSEPLANAYAVSIRNAIDTLERDYLRTVDTGADCAPFRLVATCANAVAGTEFPPDITDVAGAQRALEDCLAALLHGHDARQVAFLQKRLLPVSAVAFRKRLAQDDKAWRAFHGLQLQVLAANVSAFQGTHERFLEVLAAWSNPNTILETLRNDLQGIVEITTMTHVTVEQIKESVDNILRFFTDRWGHTGIYDSSLIDYLNVPLSVSQAQAPTTTVLVLAASSQPKCRLASFDEQVHIKRVLDSSANSSVFWVVDTREFAIENLSFLLLYYKPDIVHIVGRGSTQGRLVFSRTTKPRPISPIALGEHFRQTKTVRCVVMNECWSDDIASEIVQDVDFVVGTHFGIKNECARQFVDGLYQAIGAGLDVSEAYKAAHLKAFMATDVNLSPEGESFATFRTRSTASG